MSFPPSPSILSFPPRPTITSIAGVPTRLSLPCVPTIVGEDPKQLMDCAIAAGIDTVLVSHTVEDSSTAAMTITDSPLLTKNIESE